MISKNNHNILRLFIVLSLVVIGIFSQPALAKPGYQNELTYLKASAKSDTDDKLSYTLIGVEHYIHPLTSDGMPRREAAYLSRAGSIGVLYGSSDLRGSLDASTDDKGFLINLAERGKPWVIQWNYIKQEGTASSPVKGDLTTETTRLRVGFYLSDRTQLSVIQEKIKSDEPVNTNTRVSRLEYALKWVNLLSAKTAFNFELSVANDREKENSELNKGKVVKLAGDYYFTPDVSAGLSYSTTTHNNKAEEGILTQMRINYFVSPSFYISANAERFKASHSTGVDAENQEIFLGYRF